MKNRKQTNRIILHHSLSGFSDVETIRRWHTLPKPSGNGWEDIGYHYVISRDGKCREGRHRTLIGAHAAGRNTDSIGVCMIGNFHEYEPTLEQVDAVARLYHQLCRLYSKSLKLEYHRPHIFNLFEPKSYQTFNSCPGSKLDRVDMSEQCAKADPYGQE
jgi:hypothetical protein